MVHEKSAQVALDCKKDQSSSIGDGRHLWAADNHHTKKATRAPQPHTDVD